MVASLQVKPQLVFYGNASAQLGAGHISRLLALAAAFKKKTDYPICFFCKTCSDAMATKILDAGYCLQQAPVEFHATDLKSLHPALLIVDDYVITTYEWQQLANLAVPTIVIDDQVSNAPFFADLVVNPAPQAKIANYQERTAAQYFCLGPQFTLLRPEFARTNIPTIAQRKRLLITLGGSDVKQLALPIAQALINRFYGEDIELTLVLGGMNTQALTALQQLAEANACFSVVVNTQQMAQLMAGSGLAIAAAGGTLGELAAMRVPTLALICVDNQLPALTSPLEGGWYQAIDLRQLSPKNLSAEYSEIAQLADKAYTLWHNQSARTAMSQLAAQIVDGKGCERVVSQAFSILTNAEKP